MRKYAWTIAAAFLAAALAVGGLVAGAETNQAGVTVGFEGLGEGSLVESLQSGSGITGDVVSGSIGVLGVRRIAPNRSAAMIFDGTCLPGGTARSCTGRDSDLFFPTLGNLLIVSEDGDAADPDDAEDGVITFDFSGFGDGSVRLESFVLADTDQRRPTVSWTTTTGATGSQRVAATGNNRWRRIDLGLDDIVGFTVDLRGAGAIDDLVLVVPTTPPPTTSTSTTTSSTSTTSTTIPSTSTTSTTTTTTTTIPPTTTTTTTTTVPATGPAITMTHLANGRSADTAPGPRLIPGDTVTWTHTVTNTGTEDLWSLIVWHRGIGRADCPVRTLWVGDTVTCTVAATADRDFYAAAVDATAYAADGSAAGVTTTGHYTTVDDTTTTTTSTTSTTTTVPPAPPSLAMAVTIGGEVTDAAPGPDLDPALPVNLEYAISNTGGETLTALFVWHDGIGAADCPLRILDPGQSTVCTATTTAGSGEQSSTVEAGTWSTAGDRVATDSVVYWHTVVAPPAGPALDLEIFVDGQPAGTTPGPAVDAGAQVTIDYRATNRGGGPLYALWVWEPGYGRITCPTRTIPVDGTVVCTRQVTAGPGNTAGEAIARAWDAAGTQVEDVAEYSFFGTALAPAVDIQVYVEGWDADTPPGPRLLTPGEVIHFTYVVTNTGKTPLTGITVDDSRRGGVDCPRTDLGIGGAMTCTDDDITRWGNHGAVGTVRADAAGTAISDTDPVYWHTRDQPRIHDLRLEVSVNNNPADTAPGPIVHVPGSVQFSYVIENRGNTWMNQVIIAHPGVLESSIRCTGDRTLNAGETLRCTATVPAVSGVYAEVITVYAWDNDGRLATADDPVHYTAIQ